MLSLLWKVPVIVFVMALGIMGANVAGADTNSGGPVNGGSESGESSQTELYVAMQGLWSDHVWWTREYIISFVDGDSGAAAAAADRLLQNQEDIGAAFSVYYGDEAGDELTALLKEHIAIAVKLVAAAKAGDMTALNNANEEWQDNADEIAEFLADQNSNWSEDELQDLMRGHLQTTLVEAAAEIHNNHEASVRAFDAVLAHIYMFSDVLSAGTIEQFPEEF